MCYEDDKYIQTSDYTVWMKMADGQKRYFVKYHGLVDSSTIEISKYDFVLYTSEFYRPLERQRNEKRRHIDSGDMDSLILSDEFMVAFEAEAIAMADMVTALKSCTDVQKYRLIQHYIYGYSFADLAKSEGCGEAAVRHSISLALKKIKKFFKETTD